MPEEKTLFGLKIDTSPAVEGLKKLEQALTLKNLNEAIKKVGDLEIALTKLPSGTHLFDEMFRQLQKYTTQYEQSLSQVLSSNTTKEETLNSIIQKQEQTQDKVLIAYAKQLDKIDQIARKEQEAAQAAERRASKSDLSANMSALDKTLDKITRLELDKLKVVPGGAEYNEINRQLDALRAKYEDIAGLIERSSALEGGELAHIIERRAESEQKIALEKARQQDAALKYKNIEVDTAKVQEQQKQIVDQIYKRMIQMVALRALRQMWQEAVKYATEYYDALNEIRLVTGMSQDEANQLGQQYRELADDMHVTSTSLITSVTSLYRQGLSDNEVYGRLKQITEFATVAGIEVEEATRLMTSSINNFIEEGEDGGQAAQRIADTYANFGDRVATDAESIATAMTKTAASASNVGMSLERTAAYASTILAVTQDEAESVGNALNTIISRYSRITKTGFGRSFEFDGETVNVNDVAQALSEAAGINVFDYDAGQFRDFGEVLDELAAKWGSLTERERNYIATQLAGTRQYNRVLTLMQNYDMAMELLESSYTDTGTVAQKYAVWTESVAAAQNNLKNSLEELYSVLSGEYLKTAYNLLAGVVDVIAEGIKLTDGLPLKITAGVAALGVLGLALGKVVQGVMALVSAMKTLGTLKTFGALTGGNLVKTLTSNLGMMATGIAGAAVIATSVVGLIAKAVSDANQRREEAWQESIAAREDALTAVESLQSAKATLDEIGLKSTYTTSEMESLNKVRLAILETSPGIASAYGLETEEVLKQANAYGILNNAIKAAQQEKMSAAYTSAFENQDMARRSLVQAGGVQAEYREAQQAIGLWEDNYRTARLTGTSEDVTAAYKQLSYWRAQLAELESQFGDLYRNGVNNAITVALGYDPEMDEGAQAAMSRFLEAAFSATIDGADIDPTLIREKVNEYAAMLVGNADLFEEANALIAQYSSDMSEEALAAWNKQADMLQDKFLDSAGGDLGLFGLMYDYNPIAVFLRNQAEAVTAAADDFEAEIEEAEDSIDTTLDNLYKTIEKSMKKREATAAAANGYDDQWMGMLEALTGLSAEGQRNRIAEGTYGSFLNTAVSMMEPQVMIDWIKKLYESNETLTTEMLEEFPALAELVFAGDAATVEQLQAALEEWQTHIDDVTKSIADSYNRSQAAQGGYFDIAKQFGFDWAVNGFDAAWESLGEQGKKLGVDLQTELAKAYPILQKIVTGAEDATDAMWDFNAAVQVQNLKNLEETNEVMDGTGDAIENAAKSAVEFAGSEQKLTGEAKKLADAQQALYVLQNKMNFGIEEQQAAMDTLASYTGYSADQLRSNLAPAEEYVAVKSTEVSGTVQGLINYLATIGAVNLGAGNITQQLEAIAAGAYSTASAVAGLALELQNIGGSATNAINTKGRADKANSKTGGTTVRSGGGGGGGGGGGSRSRTSYSDRLISSMTDSLELSDHARELAQQAQAYYEVRRELQGVIRYMEVERRLVEDENKTLEGYLKNLEDAMVKYAGNADELAKLQAQHQEYSLRLLKNKTDVENLTKSIKAQNDAIRKMEIELRNTILQAIEDREAREERMLQGRVKMENEMIALLKKRYEKERDEILETAELREKALEDEKNAIDELLEARKKQEESEDRLQKIAELEAKITRISADPTRQKEAASLREELAKLRNDLAWEEAETEAEAQKKALDDQIQNIEDYKTYVEEYYEELLNNPRRLMEELTAIIESSDEAIIAWLKENSEDFAKATDATQQTMIEGWQATLLDMRGAIEVYWEEVESIIARGDDYIIQFLKEHSAAYAEAGKLQAEAYVDEWMDQLEALHLAYKVIEGDINPYSYSSTTTTTSSSGGGGGGGGGGGSGSGNSISAASVANTKNAISSVRDKLGAAKTPTNTLNSYRKSDILVGTHLGKKTISMYASGGLNDYTGLAMLHGTPQEPEAVLNPQQTKLFQQFVAAMTQIPKVNVPLFGGVDTSGFAGGGGIVVNGMDIKIDVNSLDNDTDIEDAADKLGNAFLKRIQRGMSVGGVRFGNR